MVQKPKLGRALLQVNFQKFKECNLKSCWGEQVKRHPFFRLTSGYGDESEIIKAPRPPQPTPDLDDKTYQICSENNSPSSFSRSTSFASDAAIFSEDLELGYRELFHYRLNSKSRLDYNTFEAVKHNYIARPDKPLILKEENSSQKYLDKCVSPNMKASRAKSGKAIPVVLQKQAVKRRPNTANIPVKLRLQHRSNAFTKFNKVQEEISTDERVLPITLNKPTDASFSVMTPYMANVVWSVMDDENVVWLEKPIGVEIIIKATVKLYSRTVQAVWMNQKAILVCPTKWNINNQPPFPTVVSTP